MSLSLGRRIASASRVFASAFTAAALALMVAACVTASPASTGAIDTASAPVPAATLDCAGLARLEPDDAAEKLSNAGRSVAWRLVHTTADGSWVADVVQAAPEGVIVDIVIDGDEAIVFVADASDPAAVSPPPPAC